MEDAEGENVGRDRCPTGGREGTGGVGTSWKWDNGKVGTVGKDGGGGRLGLKRSVGSVRMLQVIVGRF